MKTYQKLLLVCLAFVMIFCVCACDTTSTPKTDGTTESTGGVDDGTPSTPDDGTTDSTPGGDNVGGNESTGGTNLPDTPVDLRDFEPSSDMVGIKLDMGREYLIDYTTLEGVNQITVRELFEGYFSDSDMDINDYTFTVNGSVIDLDTYVRKGEFVTAKQKGSGMVVPAEGEMSVDFVAYDPTTGQESGARYIITGTSITLKDFVEDYLMSGFMSFESFSATCTWYVNGESANASTALYSGDEAFAKRLVTDDGGSDIPSAGTNGNSPDTGDQNYPDTDNDHPGNNDSTPPSEGADRPNEDLPDRDPFAPTTGKDEVRVDIIDGSDALYHWYRLDHDSITVGEFYELHLHAFFGMVGDFDSFIKLGDVSVTLNGKSVGADDTIRPGDTLELRFNDAEDEAPGEGEFRTTVILVQDDEVVKQLYILENGTTVRDVVENELYVALNFEHSQLSYLWTVNGKAIDGDFVLHEGDILRGDYRLVENAMQVFFSVFNGDQKVVDEEPLAVKNDSTLTLYEFVEHYLSDTMTFNEYTGNGYWTVNGEAANAKTEICEGAKIAFYPDTSTDGDVDINKPSGDGSTPPVDSDQEGITIWVYAKSIIGDDIAEPIFLRGYSEITVSRFAIFYAKETGGSVLSTYTFYLEGKLLSGDFILHDGDRIEVKVAIYIDSGDKESSDLNVDSSRPSDGVTHPEEEDSDIPTEDTDWPAEDTNWPTEDTNWPTEDTNWPTEDTNWPTEDITGPEDETPEPPEEPAPEIYSVTLYTADGMSYDRSFSMAVGEVLTLDRVLNEALGYTFAYLSAEHEIQVNGIVATSGDDSVPNGAEIRLSYVASVGPMPIEEYTIYGAKYYAIANDYGYATTDWYNNYKHTYYYTSASHTLADAIMLLGLDLASDDVVYLNGTLITDLENTYITESADIVIMESAISFEGLTVTVNNTLTGITSYSTYSVPVWSHALRETFLADVDLGTCSYYAYAPSVSYWNINEELPLAGNVTITISLRSTDVNIDFVTSNGIKQSIAQTITGELPTFDEFAALYLDPTVSYRYFDLNGGSARECSGDEQLISYYAIIVPEDLIPETITVTYSVTYPDEETYTGSFTISAPMTVADAFASAEGLDFDYNEFIWNAYNYQISVNGETLTDDKGCYFTLIYQDTEIVVEPVERINV